MVQRTESNHIWEVATPQGAVRADIPRLSTARRALAMRLGELPLGATVVLAAKGLLSARRCRRFAVEARLQIKRQFLVFPSMRSPLYLVEDAREPIRYFSSTMVTIPPGVVRMAGPLDVLIALSRRSSAWRLVRLVSRGRVAVGERT